MRLSFLLESMVSRWNRLQRFRHQRLSPREKSQFLEEIRALNQDLQKLKGYGKTSPVFLIKVKIRTINSFNLITWEHKVIIYADVTEEEVPMLVQRDFPEAKIASISKILLGTLLSINI